MATRACAISAWRCWGAEARSSILFICGASEQFSLASDSAGGKLIVKLAVRLMSFERNVFINCPFDPAYAELLRPIIFTILYFGLEPRLASERLNSAEPRIGKIVELIREAKFGIHDLSRMRASKKGELFRLNMPLELGIDLGCRLFGGGAFAGKRLLILEAERYRYQAALSDLSGSDIATHRDEPLVAMRCVRNWLVSELRPRRPIGGQGLWGKFNDFADADYDAMKQTGHSDVDIETRPISDMTDAMREWIAVNKSSR